jgi:hypothetical protein
MHSIDEGEQCTDEGKRSTYIGKLNEDSKQQWRSGRVVDRKPEERGSNPLWCCFGL